MDRKEYYKQWKKENKDTVKAYHQNYYAGHKETMDAQATEWARQHPEIQRERNREAYKKRAARQ